MEYTEAVQKFKDWAIKIEKIPYKENARNSLKSEIYKQILLKLEKGESLSNLYDYVMDQFKTFDGGSDRNGPIWARHEYEVLQQKLWGLVRKLKKVI